MDKNSVLANLSESDKTRFGKESFASQSTPQKVFSAVWDVESEVNNGDFSQYFFNRSAESACFAVEALQTIGAPQRQISADVPYLLPFRTAYPQPKNYFFGCRRFLRRHT